MHVSGTPACTGVTHEGQLGVHHGDIAARVWAHREGRGSSFCARFGLTRLVYAEHAPTIEEAIAREKAIKKWNRAWKIELIEHATLPGITCSKR